MSTTPRTPSASSLTISSSTTHSTSRSRPLPLTASDQQRTSSTQNAATTPYRRSMADLVEQLNSLFDSLPTSTSSRTQSPLVADGANNASASLRPRTAPLRVLPELFAAFEHRRGVEILSQEEKDNLRDTVAALPDDMQEQPVGVDEVLGILVKMGVTANDTPRQLPRESTAQQEPAASDSMLPIEPDSRPGDGSPVSSRHRRNMSSASASSARSNTPASPSPTPSTPLARASLIPAASPASRRRSLMSNLSRQSSLESPRGSGTGKTLRKKKTFEDLSNMIVQQGGKYLGVGLDGPTGSDWEAGELSLKLRAVLSAKGPHRDRDLGALLTGLTYPQLKSLNESYSSHFGKPLLDVLANDRTFKGPVEFIVKGLLVGPLAWDVHLLQTALDAEKLDDVLLVELLIGRSPSSLALLRAAYSHRSTLRSLAALASGSSGSSAPASTSSRSLDVAVLSAFSSGQLRLRKAWEVALQGRWDDCPSSADASSSEEDDATPHKSRFDDERRRKLVREDLDQVKVALRRGGNTELVSKILLARSPEHLGELDQEYRKSTAGHSSLSKAIKQSVGAGTLQQMLLHAVRGGRRKSHRDAEGKEFDVTVWRDAKKLVESVEKLRRSEDSKGKDVEVAGREQRNELAWRLVRLHWNRPRFSAVQAAYQQKCRGELAAHLEEATPPSSAIRDIFASLASSASLPEPIATVEDQQRLERPPSRARTISTDSLASNSSDPVLSEDASRFASSESEAELEAVKVKGYASGHSKSTSGSEVEAGDIEAQGEMSDPPSPRSPPPPTLHDEQLGSEMEGHDRDDSTPNVSSMSTFTSQSDVSSPGESNESFLPRSTSSLSFTSSDGFPSAGFQKTRRPSSSLSTRSRPGGLPNLNTHRPPSSASGSAGDRSIASLRHSRPIAPSRAKRRQSEDPTNRERSASTEPLSPTDAHAFAARSPTPSGRPRSSLGRSTSSGSISLSTSHDSFALVGSPGIDETSFHRAPLSPVGDIGPSSSSFSSAFPGMSPAPASPSPFDLSVSSDIFGTVGDSPGFGTRRHSTTESTGGSRPSSHIFSGLHSRDGTSLNGEYVQQLVQQISDLQRKLKDAEDRLQADASAFEQDQSDLEARLEEVAAELQAKRREEKELRNNEKQHLGQISSLEGDIAKLTKSLEKSRESLDSMKRNYTETCEEAERLRAVIAETRRDNRAAEESIQGHALQVQQFERDREMLQQGINKLEEDLEDARKAHDTLEDQKQENLVLKETIDRLRFDLDEMRNAARKSTFLDPGAITDSPGKTLQASISRSLGKELASQLEEEADSESEAEETSGEGEGEDEIIVTTHRRIKKRAKKNAAPSEPLAQHLETTLEVADADIQTDLFPMLEHEAQTDLSGVGVDLVVAQRAPPPVTPTKTKTAKERKEEAAKELGVDIELVKQYLETQKPSNQRIVELSAPASPRRVAGAGRWRSRMLPGSMVQAPSLLISYFPTAARPYVGQVLDSGVTLMLYSATIFLFGILTGAHLLPVNHYHYLTPFSGVLAFSDPSAYGAMASWEGLVPGATGNGGLAREGIAQFFYELVWSGVQTARRIPV